MAPGVGHSASGTAEYEPGRFCPCVDTDAEGGVQELRIIGRTAATYTWILFTRQSPFRLAIASSRAPCAGPFRGARKSAAGADFLISAARMRA